MTDRPVRLPLRVVRLPGVFRPPSDTWMLARRLLDEIAGGRPSVLDVCTGSGALAIVAARAGARVTAVDVSRRAVVSTRLGALLHRVHLRALRGDLLAPVRGERFDIIVSNPPYVPGASDSLPRHAAARAWEGGRDGRLLVDRLCAEAPACLAPGGVLLIVQSSLAGIDDTVDRLAVAGLEVDVPDRHVGPLGPIVSARAAELERRGVLAPGQRTEELAVVRARRRAA